MPHLSRIIYYSVFLSLLLYCVLRAIYVVPLFDESCSFFGYFIYGDIWSPTATLDANNHLLVSYVAHWLFELGGDDFFFFRLLSIVGFVLYFIALDQLTHRWFKFYWPKFITLCLVGIPWLLDYAALARGYGFALGGFLIGLVLVFNYIERPKTIFLLGFYLLNWLILFACIPFTIPVFLLIGVLGFYHVWKFRSISWRQIITYIITTLAFFVCYQPLIQYNMKLKEAGLFWWGSREGLWEVTGKSISKQVLFTDSIFIQFALYALIVGLVIFSIFSMKKNHWKVWMNNTKFVFSLYYLLLLLSLVLFSTIVKMNYPMDRVGMYLVPLTLLGFVLIVQSKKWLKYASLITVFFPISLLLSLNLNTTVFSPTDRINWKTYNEINKRVPLSSSLSGDWMSYIMYSYNTSQTKSKRIFTLEPTTGPASEYLLRSYCGVSCQVPGYKLVFRDKQTDLGLFKRIDFQIQPWKSSIINHFEFTSANKVVFNMEEVNAFTKQSFLVQLSGSVELNKLTDGLKIRVFACDNQGQRKEMLYSLFHTQFYRRKNFEFNVWSTTLPAGNYSSILVEMENPRQAKVALNRFKISLFNQLK